MWAIGEAALDLQPPVEGITAKMASNDARNLSFRSSSVASIVIAAISIVASIYLIVTAVTTKQSEQNLLLRLELADLRSDVRNINTTMAPYLCCLMGICCPPFTEQQRNKLATILMERKVCATMDDAYKVADFHIGLVKDFIKKAAS